MSKRPGLRVALSTLPVLLAGHALAQTVCSAWSEPIEIGQLDGKILDEESGLAVSRRYPKLYHINDSGGGPYFYVTDRDGSHTKKIRIEGFKAKDTEEIALGPCPEDLKSRSTKCLAIGDIGDNFERRKSIEVVFLLERKAFGSSVKPVARVELKYPDRPHNAEAFAVLPNGDLVIVTKEGGRLSGSHPAQVFGAQSQNLIDGIKKKRPVALEHRGEIDVPALTGDKGLGGLVTAMSLSGDGRRFVLMTYGKALEFDLDLANARFPPTLNQQSQKSRSWHSIVSVRPLVQQESIAYDTNDRDLLYSTEVGLDIFGTKKPPLMKTRCK